MFPVKIDSKIQDSARNEEGGCCPDTIIPGLLNGERDVGKERGVGDVHREDRYRARALRTQSRGEIGSAVDADAGFVGLLEGGGS